VRTTLGRDVLSRNLPPSRIIPSPCNCAVCLVKNRLASVFHSDSSIGCMTRAPKGVNDYYLYTNLLPRFNIRLGRAKEQAHIIIVRQVAHTTVVLQGRLRLPSRWCPISYHTQVLLINPMRLSVFFSDPWIW
jgi:hypothetical protein